MGQFHLAGVQMLVIGQSVKPAQILVHKPELSIAIADGLTTFCNAKN